MLNWGMRRAAGGGGVYLSIYNGKPSPCFCCADRCYLCQSLFLLSLSPPSFFLDVPSVSPSTVFLLISLSHSYVFFLVLLFCASPSILFLPSTQMQRRQLCRVLKCAWLKPLGLASAAGKHIITNPHYRHPSPSPSASLSCHLPAI